MQSANQKRSERATRRHMGVYALACAGYSIKQIAAHIGVKPQTAMKLSGYGRDHLTGVRDPRKPYLRNLERCNVGLKEFERMIREKVWAQTEGMNAAGN